MVKAEVRIGTLIKEYRDNNNLTQEQLGEMLFVTPQAVSKYENHKIVPGVDTLIILSSVINCSVSYMLTGNDRPYLVKSDINRNNDILLIETNTDDSAKVYSVLLFFNATYDVVKTKFIFNIEGNDFKHRMGESCNFFIDTNILNIEFVYLKYFKIKKTIKLPNSHTYINIIKDGNRSNLISTYPDTINLVYEIPKVFSYTYAILRLIPITLVVSYILYLGYQN